MKTATSPQSADAPEIDVLIVGAGLSGIGAAAHLTMQCPDKNFMILEQRNAIGGTWDLFRYPGIRSDSDMHTLGYRFKPWLHEKSIADAPAILDYINEVADDYAIRRNIRFGHQMLSADWSSAAAQWIVTARNLATGEEQQIQARFLFLCAGYYDYDQGYRPDFPGEDDFAGQIVHPQHWPDNLDVTGKRVVVIGSGATAVTIVPVIAKRAASVTMLQRTPTWIIERPARDKLANTLRKMLPEKLAYKITRWKNMKMQRILYDQSRINPKRAGDYLLGLARKRMPDVPDFDVNFTPPYAPWDQRLCLIPDGDLFEALNDGTAQVVTDHIDHFTREGITLKSGKTLPADIIVTATGLKLILMGKAQLSIDGAPINIADRYNYKGAMFSDIPNMASVFGYINASWTLKTDIVCDYVCRLLKEMDRQDVSVVTPVLGETTMPRLPFAGAFSSGYFARADAQLPANGDRHPWRVIQDYRIEKRILTQEPVDDGVMVFSNPAPLPPLADHQPLPQATPIVASAG